MALGGCALRPVERVEIGDLINCSRKVLIATQQSGFKESIVAQVTDALSEDACYIRVVDLTELEAETPEEYDAVIIANTCIAWRVNRAVRAFLKEFEARERVFLITTADGEDCGEPPAGVDAVTAASKTGRSSEIAQEVVEKVRELLI
jgi:menaquinone-dependent protoporphyrinogen IX oxidase